MASMLERVLLTAAQLALALAKVESPINTVKLPLVHMPAAYIELMTPGQAANKYIIRHTPHLLLDRM